MTEELPGGGTDQHPAASQAATDSDFTHMESGDTAASRPEEAVPVEAASGASQQQASRDQNPVSEDLPEAAAEAGDGSEQAEDSDSEDNDQEDMPPEDAPEHYAFQPVEGVQFSDDVLGSFSEVAKELDLSRDAAQQILDRVAPAIARQQQAAIQAVNAEWVSQVKADKEIGGDRLQQNLAIAKKARDAFGTDGLRVLLNESRIGNHPEMIRFFVRAGQAISEDSFVAGGTRPPSAGRDAATVLYGKQN